MKKVSIIVPIYNSEKFLRKCLNSIKNQDYDNFEALLINDGSTDDCKSIMEKFAKNDKRFRCFYKQNGGVSDARNYGIDHAKGEYICFIDSDDYVTNNYLSKLVNRLETEKSDISVCNFERIYSNNKTVSNISVSEVLCYRTPAVWNKLFVKNIIYENKLYFPVGIWYEDLVFSSEYLMLTNKISIVDDPLYFYVQNSNSIMHTIDNRIYQIYDALSCLENFAKKKNIYSKTKYAIEFAYIYHCLVGTIFRISFSDSFCVNDIRDIADYVEKKYPKWYENMLIKKSLGFVYRLYLNLIKNKQYKLMYILLKAFNKYMYL